MKTVSKIKQLSIASVSEICRCFDLKRDAYYKFQKRYTHHKQVKSKVLELQVTRPNQVWVSDITYIRTVKGFCYLALITDVYSRRIVGDDISDTLELTGCLRALKIALRHARPVPGMIHHSDRGIQCLSCSRILGPDIHKLI